MGILFKFHATEALDVVFLIHNKYKFIGVLQRNMFLILSSLLFQ